VSDIRKASASQSARSNDPRDRLHLFSAHVRRDHVGADRRRLCRAHEVSAMLWVIGCGRSWSTPRGALGMGPDGFLSSGKSERLEKGYSILRAAPSCTINSGVAGLMTCIVLASAKGYRPLAQYGAHLSSEPRSLGRLVRLQCRIGSVRRHAAGMAMLVTHMATAAAAFVWMLWKGVTGQADRDRHLHRCSLPARRHHSCLRLCRSDRRAVHRRCSGGHLLLGMHRSQAMLGYDDAL